MSIVADIKIHNTLSGKPEKLETRTPGKLTFYSCGPTVYDLIHIGNLRAALVSDLFFRFFKYVGYEVTYVRNYTDIDDKIIKRANEKGIEYFELTKKFIQEVEQDYAAAGMLDPTHKTLATEHIAEMLTAIEALIEKGLAYEVNGEVLFAIDKFKGYGKLSHKDIDDLIAGSRVEVNQAKKNPLDFTLWKPAKPDEPSWDSPWGKGRPGWHIECSVMSSKWLGEQIDVHHGGIDLIFPHHENEIAQSEGVSGKAPFVKYWLHNGFVTLSKEKMSKSLGNVFVAREFLKQFNGEVARFLFLSVHYRSPLDFSQDTVDQAISGLERLYEAKQEALKMKAKPCKTTDPTVEEKWGEFAADCVKAENEMVLAYANDFNTAGALGVFFTLTRKLNRTLKDTHQKGSSAGAQACAEYVSILEKELGDVLGIGKHLPQKALADLNRVRATRGGSEAAGAEKMGETEILKLIQDRKDARAAKDFKQADSIRDQLFQAGVEIKDSPQGTTWKYR